jgi:hypothetical protein
MNIKHLKNKIKSQFTDENAKKFLSSYWRNKRKSSGIESTGFCYLASSSFKHLVDDSENYVVKKWKKTGDDSHFWVENKLTGEIIDLTGDQYIDGFSDYSNNKNTMNRKKLPLKLKKFIELLLAAD